MQNLYENLKITSFFCVSHLIQIKIICPFGRRGNKKNTTYEIFFLIEKKIKGKINFYK